MKFNESLGIAYGRNRKETHWKNKEITWEELVEKLSKTHRTTETQTEYAAGTKAFQDEKKDNGGFVGGRIRGGRRLKNSIIDRQLITLDIDFGPTDLWQRFQLCFPEETAVLYSTHKHTPDKPRLRLVMPLNQAVFPSQYQAIARWVAGILNIDIFDDTTFEPHRLMYWPSTSKDGEFLFEYQDGKALDAEKVLSTYADWRDESQWPVSSRVDTAIQRDIKKQGDPLEKPGVLGAFCRARTIQEVIEEYLSDEYAHAGEDRYTFINGSTAAGLKIYDDKFAYSHHGTDPTSGKLCNAFDLVRIHKFGLKDEDAKENTPVNKLPSYLAMLDLATKDNKVKLQLNEERMAEAEADFNDTKYDAPDNDWAKKLEIDRKGKPYQTIDNVSIILENHPLLKDCFAIDDFMGRKVVLRDLPWRKKGDYPFVRDEDEMQLIKFLEKHYDISSKSIIELAFSTHLDGRRYHPVRDYLNSLTWDGKKRIDTLFADYLGAENTEYTRAVTRKSLIAAVARIFVPGIKYDYVLTLTGKEGIGKSTIFQKLGGKWFSDSFNFNVIKDDKKAIEQMSGSWIIEIGELTGMRRAELEAVKHFLGKREDRARKSYGHNTDYIKRQCIFFGSTNEAQFLRDTHGNRRFWPIDTEVQSPTKNIWKDLTQSEVDQIWAEAVHYFRKGEKIYLEPKIERMARALQAEHLEQDERVGQVEEYLERKLPDDWNQLSIRDRINYLDDDPFTARGNNPRSRVCAAEIWVEAFRKDRGDLTQMHARTIHGIMRNIKGWREYKSRTMFSGYGNQRGYYKEGYVLSGHLKFEITNNEKN